MNPGPRNVSRGVRDCSWSLWRPQGRAPRASRTEMSRGLRQPVRRRESRSHRPCRRTSVRANTSLVHAPVRPWSPHLPRLRRGPKSARTSALRVPAATSGADRRRRRSTRSSQSTSKAGSRLGRSLSSPFRRTSNGSCGRTSPVASSASDLAGHAVHRAGRVLSWPPGRAGCGSHGNPWRSHRLPGRTGHPWPRPAYG